MLIRSAPRTEIKAKKDGMMNGIVKRLLRAKLVPALLSIVFGIVLIIARRSAVEIAVKIAAGMLVACGIGCLLMYLFAPVRESMQLVVGGFLAAVGLLAWFNTDLVVDLFPILTGITLILNGLSNFAPLTSPGENAGTSMIVVFSGMMILGGLFIIFHRGAAIDVLMIYMGVIFIVNGILDLVLLHRVKDILLS